MTFNVFDAIDSISQRNPFFFGFSSFTKKFFKTLQLGFELYAHSRFKKTGLNKDRMSLRECFDAIRGFRRRENDVAVLQKPQTWNLFSTHAQQNVVLQQQLAETQRDFEHHEKFSVHTNESLVDAYEKLGQIESLLRCALEDILRAKKRWFWSRQRKDLLKKYHEYVDQQLAILKQEREDCVLNMLARLIQVAHDPFLENTDTLPGIIQDLKTKGFLKASYTAPVLSDNSLTQHLFYKFHSIIKKEGDGEVLSALHSLPWFRHRPDIASRFKVSHLVPRSKKRPAFLFYNHNVRHHWFDDYHVQAKIDATLNYLRMGRVVGELNAASLSKRMVSLHSAEHALQMEKNRVTTARRECQEGFRKYFNRETLQFLDEIQATHKKLAIQLLNEKIELLRFIHVTPLEEIQSLDIVKFLDSFLDANICEKTNTKFNYYRREIRKKLEVFMEGHLQRYFLQWSSCSRLKELNQQQLDVMHSEADTQEQLLFRVLPDAWTRRVQAMRSLRTGNRWKAMEMSAQKNLKDLVIEKRAIVQKLVSHELQTLRESLIEYLHETVKDFDYADQKNALSKMVLDLAKEEGCEAEKSARLSSCERLFLKSFPEVNFFINVMLMINQKDRLLKNICNPQEIEEHINTLYRFIRKQEAQFLNKNQPSFSTLFCKPEQPSVPRVLIHQLKRVII